MKEDWTPVEQVDREPGTIATLEREAFCRAVRRVAASTGGIVTAAQIRAELKTPINEHRVGGIMNGFANRGVFVRTKRTAPSDDIKNRNRNREMPVWYVPNLEAVK